MNTTRATIRLLLSTPIAGLGATGFVSGEAARFKAVVGQTPLEYLSQWRMYCATCLLQHSSMALADVSRQVGYESVAAFNRVFRRETAMTTGAFRRSAEAAEV